MSAAPGPAPRAGPCVSALTPLSGSLTGFIPALAWVPGWSMSLTVSLTLFPAVMLTLRPGIAVVGVKMGGAGEDDGGVDGPWRFKDGMKKPPPGGKA